MPHYHYLIIGAGMTADAAVSGIREADANGSIGVIGSESSPPYKRPWLTKKLWRAKPVEGIWLEGAAGGAELRLGTRATTLEVRTKRVVDDQGVTYTFDKLLIATGGTPRRLQFDPGHVIYFRTFDDYQRLRAATEGGRRFAVIGGGFIGSEIAAALAMNGREAVMIFPEEGISGPVFPKDLVAFLNGYYREKGVEIISEDVVSEVGPRGDRILVTTLGGRELEVDCVVAGLGINPNTEIAEAAGIQIENGIKVDEFLRAGHPDVFAAGDVASFYNPALGKRIRVEHEDNATTMGHHAGRAMAGQAEPYHHLPYFYSDLFDLGYEAVGELDPRMDIVADWKEPYKEGVVYYLRDGRVRGALLWNVWDKVPAARELIAASGPFEPEDLEGRISN